MPRSTTKGLTMFKQRFSDNRREYFLLEDRPFSCSMEAYRLLERCNFVLPPSFMEREDVKAIAELPSVIRRCDTPRVRR